MKQKKPVMMARLTALKKADRSFDLEFWRRVGTQGKFEAAWDMVLHLAKWNSRRYAPQQRLRRSVSALKLR